MEVKRHSFQLAKSRLNDFTTKSEAEFSIDKVEKERGFLRLGNHKVTGDELNIRLSDIQKNFVDINKSHNNFIKEFREVYNALDALDEEYIASILSNVRAIEKTSSDVRVQQDVLKEHHDNLLKQQSKLDAHQIEIEKNVTNISKIVKSLRAFKENLDSYEHLKDIDKFYDEYQNFKMVQEEYVDDYQSYKSIQEKAYDELRLSQESTAGQFVMFQKEYNSALQEQRDSQTEAKNFQEEAAKKIQYLSVGLGVNFIALLVLLILIVSGVI
jgi:hypothetical protein